MNRPAVVTALALAGLLSACAVGVDETPRDIDQGTIVLRNGSDAAAQPGLQWTAEEEAYRQVLDEVAGRWRAFEDRRRTLADEVKRGARSSDDPEVAQLDARRVQLEASTTTAQQEAGRRFVAAAQAAHVARLAAFGEARTELATKLAEIHARGDGGLPTAGLLLLPMVQGCGKKGISGEIQAFKDAGRSVSEFADTDAASMQAAIRSIGRVPRERTTLYGEVARGEAPRGEAPPPRPGPRQDSAELRQDLAADDLQRVHRVVV